LIATRARAELRIVLRPYLSMAREKNVAMTERHTDMHCIPARDEKITAGRSSSGPQGGNQENLNS
jgi:hypothetical protein